MKNYLFRRFLLLGIFMVCGIMKAQTITGIVSEAYGPLPGASVLIKGTTIGAQTDLDGKFQISGVTNDAVLIFSYIGYISQEVSVKGQKTINVTLKENAQALDEVIIVAYGTSRKKDVTGAVATIKAESLTSSPKYYYRTGFTR
ncbi:hypothetical protein RCH18_001197 [Flavobacterium sp. PL11]|jgi:hypothetical protein|uniref:carboxypeptidase-like regulatory domain-containing protein n=1 Tax=Flavobacterium sp. PL11 TaxID=3071717 RepID=UPI002DFC573C|nr:hypothetical protein [Flavobacterium sp. PL11]